MFLALNIHILSTFVNLLVQAAAAQRGLELRWHRSAGNGGGARGRGRARARTIETRYNLL